jgi:hypothetical protein
LNLNLGDLFTAGVGTFDWVVLNIGEFVDVSHSTGGVMSIGTSDFHSLLFGSSVHWSFYVLCEA